MSGFDLFIGIDWSGANSSRLKGIRLAACRPGRTAPVLLDGPQRDGLWRRQDVLDHLLERIATGERTLVGFDFAFAYAHADVGAYFPGLEPAPVTVRELWALIERLAGEGQDLYGGAVYGPAAPLAHYYWRSGPRPHGFVERRRRTEIACSRITWPHPVFKCFSAANVGTGSLAGMRLLHRLGDRAAIWPFDERQDFTVVEIFPRLYFKRVKADPLSWRDPAVINAALVAYGSEPYTGPPLDIEDKADAVVAAAALRALSADPAVWTAPADEPSAIWEGWIFGVESAKPGAP